MNDVPQMTDRWKEENRINETKNYIETKRDLSNSEIYFNRQQCKVQRGDPIRL